MTVAAGKPLAGAKLFGWPKSQGSGAGAQSDDDGRFTVYLPQDEPYTLEATHPDFLKWGNRSNRDTLFEPMTHDISIRLEPAAKTCIEVVDGESNLPIERFGFRILEGIGSAAKQRRNTERHRPPLEDHPGGIVASTGRLGEDLYLVYAPGYRMASGDMTHDEGRGPSHVVRRDRGASVRGRVEDEGVAVPGATVEIVEVQGAFLGRPAQMKSNTRLRAKTDSDGRFEWSGLEAVPHRLSVHSHGGTSIFVDSKALALGETYDFGDIALKAAGAIEGRVLLPPGVNPAALRVHLGDWKDRNEQITDSLGNFRFENVAPGTYSIGHHARPAEIDGGALTEVEVHSGKTASAELDLRPMVFIDVNLTLDLDGLPTEGIGAILIEEDAPEFWMAASGLQSHVPLGAADSAGRVSGKVRAMGRAKVQLAIPSVGFFQHPSAQLDLIFPGPVEAVLQLELATLELELPQEWPLPQEGNLYVELGDAAREGHTMTATAPIVDGALDLVGRTWWKQEKGRIVIQGFPPGPHKVTVYTSEKDAPSVQTQLGPNSWSYGPERMNERRAKVTLLAGQRTVLRPP